MATERTSIYISAEIKLQLAQATRRLGKTQTQLVNDALTEFLARLDKPRFAFIGSGEDSVVTAKTSEVWSRKNSKGSKKK